MVIGIRVEAALKYRLRISYFLFDTFIFSFCSGYDDRMYIKLYLYIFY